MKTVTIHVEEDDYEAFRKYAAESGKSAAAVIREAMAEYKVRHFRRKHSLLDHEPFDAGGPVEPITSEDDIFGEMIDEARS